MVETDCAIIENLSRFAGSDPVNRGQAFNAGAGRPWSVREVVDTLVEVAGSDVVAEYRGTGIPEGEIDRQYLDSTLVHTRFGWQPKFELRDGLAETFAWYERALPMLLPA